MCKVNSIRNTGKSIILWTFDGVSYGPYYYDAETIIEKQIYRPMSLVEYAAKEHGIDPATIENYSIHIQEQEDTIYITEHAAQRMKERAGWNRDTAIRMTVKAVDDGKPADEVTGRLGAWLRHRVDHHGPDDKEHWYRLYGDFVFVFTASTLVTVIRKPKPGSYFMKCTLRTEID